MILEIKGIVLCCIQLVSSFNFLSNFYAFIRLFTNSTGTFLSLAANPEFITKPYHRAQTNLRVLCEKCSLTFEKRKCCLISISHILSACCCGLYCKTYILTVI